MKSLKTSDIGEGGDENLFMMTYQTPEVDGVSSIVSIAIPIYKSDMDNAKKRLLSFVETTYRTYGYNLSSIDELSQTALDDIAILSPFNSRQGIPTKTRSSCAMSCIMSRQ